MTDNDARVGESADQKEAADLGPNAVPDRIMIDGKGYGWRQWDEHPDMWSMVPQNPDNSPVPRPWRWFVPQASLVQVGWRSRRTGEVCDCPVYERSPHANCDPVYVLLGDVSGSNRRPGGDS